MPNEAHAQSIPGLGGFDFMSLLPLALIFVVFYFFLIRPQQKKAQQQRDMLSSLRRGDRIVTNGGLIGVITKVVNDQELQVEIAEDVRVRVARAMVADCLSKTEPAAEPSETIKHKEVRKPAPKMMAKPAHRPAAMKSAAKSAPKKPSGQKKKGA